jgi:hypothetical protein
MEVAADIKTTMMTTEIENIIIRLPKIEVSTDIIRFNRRRLINLTEVALDKAIMAIIRAIKVIAGPPTAVHDEEMTIKIIIIERTFNCFKASRTLVKFYRQFFHECVSL